MHTIAETYMAGCIKMSDGNPIDITEYAFNQKIKHFEKIQQRSKVAGNGSVLYSKLIENKAIATDQNVINDENIIISRFSQSQSRSLSPDIAQNFTKNSSSLITPTLSLSDNESSSFEDNVYDDSSTDYDQSSSTDNEFNFGYKYPWSCDSDDSYAGLNEYDTLNKLQNIIGQRAPIHHNVHNNFKKKENQEEVQVSHENVLFPMENGKFLTMIVLANDESDYDNDCEDNEEISLDDVSDIFFKQIGHSPYSIQQNNYLFRFKDINEWWPNRPNPKQKPMQKPVNVYYN